jgi:hypothetical protein
MAAVGGLASTGHAATEATVCHDSALPRQRTEVDAEMSVPQFDPALGTLLEVSVPLQAMHLDTDSKFENTAQTAVQFAAQMTYQATFTSPAGLASPPALTGTMQRVPSQTLAAFDGTLDYAGPSAVTQPSTAQDAAATAVASTDPATLTAFTGTGTMPFHVATEISETFMGGGGNVAFEINTFMAANVRVCYEYAVAELVSSPPPPGDAPPATTVVAVPRTTG